MTAFLPSSLIPASRDGGFAIVPRQIELGNRRFISAPVSSARRAGSAIHSGERHDPQAVERAIERCVDVSTRLDALENESHPQPAPSSPCVWTALKKEQRWLEGRERRHGRLGRRLLRSPGTSRFAAVALDRPVEQRRAACASSRRRALVGATTSVALAAAFAGINAGGKQPQPPQHRRLASRAGRYALAILSRPREAAISVGTWASTLVRAYLALALGACDNRLRRRGPIRPWLPAGRSKITDGNRALA